MQRHHWFNGIEVNIGQEDMIDFFIYAPLNGVTNVRQKYIKIKVRMGVYPHLFFANISMRSRLILFELRYIYQKIEIMRYALAAAVALLFIASCSKFEDGPAISFRSKENRLIGKWKLTKWTEKGVDITDSMSIGDGLFYEFSDNRSVVINNGPFPPIEGTWLIEETNVIMDLEMFSDFGDYIDKDTLMLKRLTNKEMVVFYDDELETELFFEAQ
jgi:hypothetical protein